MSLQNLAGQGATLKDYNWSGNKAPDPNTNPTYVTDLTRRPDHTSNVSGATCLVGEDKVMQEVV